MPIPAYKAPALALLLMKCLIFFPAVMQSSMAQSLVSYPAPGLLIEVGGHKLHIHCEGSGYPTVVMDSGLGGSSLDWVRVQPEVAKFSRVCSYDRAGYGWSEPGPLPRTSDRNARELHALLEKAEVRAPYILVGHSYGGYNIRMFASLYPEETAGIVLVDASHEDQFERFKSDKVSQSTAPSRINSVFFYKPSTPPENMPAEVRETASSLMSSYSAYQAAHSEMSSFLNSAQQVRSADSMPNVPQVVVTRGQRVWPDGSRGDRMEALWLELQDDLASHAVGMPHLFALHGGHYIQLDEPEIVVNAIRIVLKSCHEP